jgi:hypothetical protein
VFSIVSDEAAPMPAAGGTFPPVVQDFESTFFGILLDPAQGAVVCRPNSRLYLFFSGHGFCERLESSPQAALYVANSSRIVNYNICGTQYARWARDQAAFSEVVLIMDCCRDAELYKQAASAPLRAPSDLAPAQQCKLFEIYAAPRGGKAQERAIPERGNVVHGLLTHTLRLAFDHAAPGQPRPCTQDIKGYLLENWQGLYGDQVDRPEIVLPANGEMEFGRAQAKDLVQSFKLVTAVAGSQLVIRAGKQMNVVAKISVAVGEARLERDGRSSSLPIVDGKILVPLPSTLCLISGVAGGALIDKTFQVGVADVEL